MTLTESVRLSVPAHPALLPHRGPSCARGDDGRRATGRPVVFMFQRTEEILGCTSH